MALEAVSGKTHASVTFYTYLGAVPTHGKAAQETETCSEVISMVRAFVKTANLRLSLPSQPVVVSQRNSLWVWSRPTSPARGYLRGEYLRTSHQMRGREEHRSRRGAVCLSDLRSTLRVHPIAPACNSEIRSLGLGVGCWTLFVGRSMLWKSHVC